MIGLDTNVLVRYLVGDDPAQTAAATSTIDALTEVDRGFVSLVVAVETYWVLKQTYRFPRETCVEALTRLLASRELEFELSGRLRDALDLARQGHDLADALISEAGRAAGCARTVTFDRQAAQLPGVELLT